LFGKRRAYQRKVAVADFSGVCSGDIYVLESKDPKKLLPELLPFICQTEAFFQHAVSTSAGSLSPRTNWTSLSNFTFALPPLEEQKRIVEILLAVKDQIDALKSQQQAHFHLVAAQLINFIAHCNKSSTMTVEDLVIDGPRNGFSPKVNASEAGFPTLSISAVRNGQIIIEGNLKYADAQELEVAPFFLKTGDVLVVRGNGNKFLTGKCGLVGEFPKGCFYPDLLIRLRFNEDLIRTEFAVMQWNSASTHNQPISRAKSTNGIWKINGVDILRHTLIAPPIPEQNLFLTAMKVQRAAAKDITNRLLATKQIMTTFWHGEKQQWLM